MDLPLCRCSYLQSLSTFELIFSIKATNLEEISMLHFRAQSKEGEIEDVSTKASEINSLHSSTPGKLILSLLKLHRKHLSS